MQYRLVAADVSSQQLVEIPEDYLVVGAQYTQSHNWQILCLAPLTVPDKGIESYRLEQADAEEFGTEESDNAQVSP